MPREEATMDTIDLRPHHLLDIVRDYAPDTDPDYVRAPDENGVRTVVRMITDGIDFPVRLVIGPEVRDDLPRRL